jgi:hypothetical protein
MTFGAAGEPTGLLSGGYGRDRRRGKSPSTRCVPGRDFHLFPTPLGGAAVTRHPARSELRRPR